MEKLLNFISKHWRLVYSVHKGHEDSVKNVLDKFTDSTDDFTSLYIPPFWVDLFSNVTCGKQIDIREELKPGNLYIIDAECHVFTVIFVNENTVIYTDYYMEARGEDGFRITVMNGKQWREIYNFMLMNDLRKIIEFHGADPDDNDLDIGLTNYILSIRKFDILRKPDFRTLLAICFNSGSQVLDKNYDFSVTNDDKYVIKHPPEYYIEWCRLFTLMVSLVREE